MIFSNTTLLLFLDFCFLLNSTFASLLDGIRMSLSIEMVSSVLLMDDWKILDLTDGSIFLTYDVTTFLLGEEMYPSLELRSPSSCTEIHSLNYSEFMDLYDIFYYILIHVEHNSLGVLIVIMVWKVIKVNVVVNNR